MAKQDNKTKVEKNYPDFVEAVQGLSVKELEARLVVYAKEQEKVNKAKTQDLEEGDLGRAKAQVSIMEGPYNDATKAIKAKSSYIIDLIGEKGGNVDVETEADEE